MSSLFSFGTRIIILLSFIAAIPAVTHAEGSPFEATLNCSLSDSYIGISKSLEFILYGIDLLSFEKKGDEVIFTWTQSEYEDLTVLTVKEQKLKDLISGSTQVISAELKYEGPELNLNATLRCKLK